MEAKDKFKAHGALTLVLQKEDGTNEVIHKDNIIVSVGFDFICDAIGNSVRPAAMGWIAVGTDSTAAVPGDSALHAEAARVAATYAHTPGTQTFTMTSTFNPGTGTAALTEAGVLNAATNGVMLDRVVFPVVNKGAGDTLTATFTFTLS